MFDQHAPYPYGLGGANSLMGGMGGMRQGVSQQEMLAMYAQQVQYAQQARSIPAANVPPPE